MPKYSEDKEQTDAALDKALAQYNSTPIEREAALFDRNVTNQLADTQFLGSGLKSEQAEIERHVIKMIKEGMYSYKYIQNFLESTGYQPAKIKEVFRKITGINPNDLMDPKEYYDSPPSIPGLTHAWGQCKKGKFDFCFVNAFNDGYALFGQKGDTQRDIIETFVSLKQALAALKKQVKTIFSYDKVIDEKILLSDKEMETTELAGDSHANVTASDDPITFFRKAFIEEQISEETFDNKLANLLVENYASEDQVIKAMDWKENYKAAKYEAGKIKIVSEMQITRLVNGQKNTYTINPLVDDNEGISKYEVLQGGIKSFDIDNINEDGRPMSKAQIDSELYNLIAEDVGISASLKIEAEDAAEALEDDEMEGKERELKDSPIENELSDRTPDDFFKKNTKEGKELGNAEDIKEVVKALNAARELINDYEITVHSYEYYSLPSDIEDEIKSKINSEDVERFFSSNAIISMVLEIQNKELGEELQKKALAVFESEDGKVDWDGIVKGDDNNFYAFSNDGMNKMFKKEMKNLQEQKSEEMI